jgi:hypothetical protein
MKAFSNLDLGRAATSIATGTFTVTGASAPIRIRDNDTRFDDEATNGGQTLDTSQQTLDGPFDGSFPSGRVVQSVYRYTITNNTTGEVGTAHLIRIYTGTNPRSPGSQSGPYYNVFTIPVGVGDSITLSSGNIVGQVPYADVVVCFTAGTGILTPAGEVPVEALAPGDLVVTRDDGPQPLVWAGQARVRAEGALAPVAFAAGALGNARPLEVSPNHRMLIASPQADLLFAEPELLVAAKHLAGRPGIARRSGGSVTYAHLLFERHQILCANGTWSESFYPGTTALGALERAARAEVLRLFPALGQGAEFGTLARRALRRQEAALIGPRGRAA